MFLSSIFLKAISIASQLCIIIIVIAVVKTSFKTLYSYCPWCEREVGVFAFFCALSFFLYSTILFIYLYIFIINLITVLFLVLTTFKTTTQDIAFLFTPMRCASFKHKDVFCENSPSADKT